MKSNNKRINRILLLLANSDTVITSDELSEEFGVTSRTIKSDMKEVRQIAQENGADVLSLLSKGYQLNILDPKKFSIIYEKLQLRNILIENHDDFEEQELVRDFLRLLLSTKEYTTLSEASSKLYVSISALRNILNNAKIFAKEYNLELVTVQSKGTKIEGSELNKRVLILRLFDINHHRVIVDFNNVNFDEVFKPNHYEVSEVRQLLLKILRSTS